MKTILTILNITGFIGWMFVTFLAIKGESLSQGTVIAACIIASLWFVRNLLEDN